MILFPETVEPDTWTVVFHEKSPTWWVEWLAFGRFKHVSAFAYLPGLRGWLVYDVQRTGTQIVVMPDCDAAVALLDRLYGDCARLRMRRQSGEGMNFRLGFWCVPAIKHLLGLRSGALRADALWAAMCAQGAEVIDGRAELEHGRG